MPSLSFYAVQSDLLEVLSFVMERCDCQVLESYSTPGRELVHFQSPRSVMECFKGSGQRSLGLVLYNPAMGGRHFAERFALKPGAFPGVSWRERMVGWGLIQLELAGIWKGRLEACYTNHNTETRARAWEGLCPSFGPVAEWDFTAVNRISSRINRHIRTKLAVGKVGARPVLTRAQQHIDSGVLL